MAKMISLITFENKKKYLYLKIQFIDKKVELDKLSISNNEISILKSTSEELKIIRIPRSYSSLNIIAVIRENLLTMRFRKIQSRVANN